MGSRDGERCPACQLTYGRFRTGLKWQDVVDQLKTGSEDPADWKYKRRRTVLGRWFMLKQAMWAQHLVECQRQQDYDADPVQSGRGDAWECPESANQPCEGVPF